MAGATMPLASSQDEKVTASSASSALLQRALAVGIAKAPSLPAAVTAAYRAFAAAVTAAGSDGAFAIPTARARWSSALDALDAVTFSSWLDANGIVAPAMRWYLDYCCNDDYGAGSAQVSAWAGLH